MIHHRNRRWRRSFKKLPKPIQEKAYKAFELFKQDPWHPALDIHRIRGTRNPRVYEGYVDGGHRFTFHYEDNTTIVHRNIGTHKIIDDRQW